MDEIILSGKFKPKNLKFGFDKANEMGFSDEITINGNLIKELDFIKTKKELNNYNDVIEYLISHYKEYKEYKE